jgi:hypothetical protein
MSAYICSDKQFAVIAKALFASPHNQQAFANHLKKENIKSVNHRYNERYQFRKVKLDAASQEDVNSYTGHDILRLLDCVDYQSCEDYTNYDDYPYNLAKRLLQAQGADSKNARPNLWSI